MMDDSKILDLLEQANLHMRRNEVEEGKRLYQEIIDSGTTPALRLRNLGLICQSQALYEKAIDKYKEALRLDEGCCSVHLRLGEIYAIMERFDEAILHYKRADERLRIIERYTPKGKLLDIGAAIGIFVGTTIELGWTARGLELSGFNCQYGRERLGVDLIKTDLENYKTSERFGAITMWALIEHLDSPLNGLRKVNTLLEKGGLLALSTPNLEGLCSRIVGFRVNSFWDTPEHLYFFSREILYKYLERCGFEILEYHISTQGEGRMEIYARKVRE